MSALNPRGLTRAGAVRTAAVILLAVALLSTTGCSWFRRDKGVDVDEQYIEDDTRTDLGAGSGATTGTVPSDAQAEGPRPGELLPFPELQTIYFDYDRSNIRADQVEKMQRNLQYLLDHPQDKVYIIGHCDERGTIEYNFNLGDRRAKEVAEFFRRGGVDASRIATVSRGEEEPVCTEHNESCWSRNRRAEFMRMY
ncbi:MAG TPA: OmpA family protein [Candidatus Sumerlaeota bacterium]|nr:MAG: Peptidoglycan-associated lipoprotein precursor [candidate division BRC1 bacterium ADurb.BinA292]HOE97745.1 OmpA family protein [Candidatus Sumerlaeota bacterium]HOR29433.1 OmpA family protein [Candidatus Sumerlaeota bacterium]HPK04022.1 OmpA family protein [Candidatus Sumerlaeota bacterium]